MTLRRLALYYGERQVGILHDVDPMSFEYTSEWLAEPRRFAVADIPLVAGLQASDPVQAYFENLLPEGELRVYIAQQNKASTLFSMLLAVAGDTAGAFVILREGETPRPPSYQPSSWADLARRLDRSTGSAIGVHGVDARISLAGAQDKTSIAIFEDGRPCLPRGTAPSTHILKPDIRRLPKVWHSAANETIVMRTAAHCGMQTAEVFYEATTQACVVRRFDRVGSAGAALKRLLQYDLCQLAGALSGRKYEKEGGPGVVACAELIRRHSTQPAVDLRAYAEWIFFNLYVGNNDSHAKNLSIYWLPDGSIRLTPFYDLMCTRLYPGLSRDFAFSIGGQSAPGRIGPTHVDALAQGLNMKPAYLRKLAADLALRLPSALARSLAEIEPLLPHGAKDLAEKLSSFVLATTRKTAARWSA